MRILQICPISYPIYGASGSAKSAYEISKTLSDKGYEVLLFSTDRALGKGLLYSERTENYNGVRILHAHRILSSIFDKYNIYITSRKSILFLKETIRNSDIIHIHEYRTLQNVIAHKFAKKYGIPYVLQARGSLARIMSKQHLKWIYDVLFGYKLLRGASKVIALSQTEAEQYKSMDVPEEKIEIMPNGIDLSEYADLPPKSSFKKKFGIDDDKKIILYLGRIHKIKGIDFLVKAYAYLVKELKFNDTLLVIAGLDSGYLGELEQLLSSLKITGNNDILLTGPLYGKDKIEAYVDADFFVLPSRYETFPNVILEAYACSKPVIASNVESIPDIVLHGKTGLLFQAGNIQELAKAIIYMLIHPEEAEKMGREARKLVEEKFSLEKVVGSLEAFYEKILEKRVGYAEI